MSSNVEDIIRSSEDTIEIRNAPCSCGEAGIRITWLLPERSDYDD